jgi:hypothetical protein
MYCRIMLRGLPRRREMLVAAWVLALVWCIYAIATIGMLVEDVGGKCSFV